MVIFKDKLRKRKLHANEQMIRELYNNTCVLGQGPNDDDMNLYLLLIIIDFQNFDIV